MSEDISRLLHQPIKHYAAVRLQQGRVLLDSDFNEGAVLEEEDVRRLWLDVIGAEGSPDQGFTIGPALPLTSPPSPPPESVPVLQPGDPIARDAIQLTDAQGHLQSTERHNVSIRPGTLFLGGMRFELDAPEAIAFQPDYLQLRASDLPAIGTGEFRHLYYLHAWEQSVSATEDQELPDPVLGDMDTSLRVRRMRRVEVRDAASLGTGLVGCDEAFDALVAKLENPTGSDQTSNFDGKTFELVSRARLQLQFTTDHTADPCGPCADIAGYQGSQNTTLRIMLTAPDRFVWGLDDAATLYRIKLESLPPLDTAGEAIVEMLTPPRREEELPVTNRVAEVLPFAAVLAGGDLPEGSTNPHFKKLAAELGVFARVSQSYDRATQSFRLDLSAQQTNALRALVTAWDARHPEAATLNVNSEATRYFYLRLWHQAAPGGELTLPLPRNASGAPLGDTGVVPIFTNDGRPGDFWTATLRVADTTRVVPFEMMQAGGVPPRGPRHFYTTLALVHVTPQEVETVTSLRIAENGDCRSRLRHIGDQGCFTFTVGDGVNSTGDFDSIADAIEALPSSGGRIGIRPGVYDEPIRLSNRRNVVIEGCGGATIIETPEAATGSLIEVSDCSAITLSGLTLRSVEQTALSMLRVTDLTLRGIDAAAGSVDKNGEFVAGTSESSVPLVSLSQVASADIQSVHLESAQSPALNISSCELVVLRDVSMAGTPQSSTPAESALIGIDDSALIKIEDSILRPFGQPGVSVRGARSRDIELRGLTILASSNISASPSSPTASPRDFGEDDASSFGFEPASDTEETETLGDIFENPTVSETRSAIDIEDGEGIRIARCRIRLDGSSISEHAAISVRGRDVVIESNSIEAVMECHDDDAPGVFRCVDLRGAFGGIHVRGGSIGVEIRRNRVRGGLGHGITLGSVLWHVAGTSPERAKRVGGAGTGQLAPIKSESSRIALGRNLGAGFEDDDGIQFVPVNEGSIRDLVIRDNGIHDMFASGISVITVLGLLGRGGDFVEIEGGRIEGNAIEGNLQRPGLDIDDIGNLVPLPGSLLGPSVISVLPLGGIVLGSATAGLDIVNNVIRDNRVAEPTLTSGTEDLKIADELQQARALPVNGIFVLIGDGINIAGNRVTGNGTVASGPAFPAPRAGVRAGIAVMLAGTGGADDIGDLRYVLAGKGSLSSPNSSLRIVNNTVVQPEGRALHLVATGPATIDGNYLASLGYHGADLAADAFAIGDVVFVQNLGQPWEGSDLDQVLNEDGDAVDGYTIAPHAIPYLTNVEDDSPHLFIGDGGNLLFNNNQVVYDWDVKRLPRARMRAPLSFFCAVVMGLDHVAVNGNQFALKLNNSSAGTGRTPLPISLPSPREQLLAQLLVLGSTVEVTRNRTAERVGSTALSLITNAEIMNITALNQTTHVNFVSTTLKNRGDGSSTDPHISTNNLRDQDNQVFFLRGTQTATGSDTNSPVPLPAVVRAVKAALDQTFVRLLQDSKR